MDKTKRKSNGAATKTRHMKYKVGVCKITVTVDNEDDVRSKRKSKREGYKDRSAWLRALIHEAVWDEPLLDEDYEELKRMRQKQEA